MSNSLPAWDVRDHTDQAELHYNEPLRTKILHLEDENLALKRLLRENNISWQPQLPTARVTRRSSSQSYNLPTEIMLQILSYALTSPHSIADPLCKPRPERLLVHEKTKNHIAIHFLATCRDYYIDGTRYLWANNDFVFTSPAALRNFCEVPLAYREKITQVNLRIIPRFYDDEARTHRLPHDYHPDLRSRVKLVVHQRPKENNLAQRGFRAYAWHQLVDFLEALLPPYAPSGPSTLGPSHGVTARPRLLPALERLRIDFVNFGKDLLTSPPRALHDVASHQLGCMLNELILTGLPNDEYGNYVSTELTGLLKDEGLFVDHHTPTMVALKNGLRLLACGEQRCIYTCRVVRASVANHPAIHWDHDQPGFGGFGLPPAPPEPAMPPYSEHASCRTIWKQVPTKICEDEIRCFMLFDRMSGEPWHRVGERILAQDIPEGDMPEGYACAHCGEAHPGALSNDDIVSPIDDDDDEQL
ncbi:hypothetical protein F4780DRAFT_619319 [Xylariomycetidae sp. FL0641]|nr:hypothetical protein F4780DRAFT_619319 [Xylariomycetidae sp. FL0641]